MNGKTFVRAFLFSNAYGHEWANILCSPDDFDYTTQEISPFARAVEERQYATNSAERAAAEAKMVWLVDTLGRQETLVKSVGEVQRFLDEKHEDNDDIEPGIYAEKAFSIGRDGSLRYDHVTRTGRLEVHAHNGAVNFSISRPNEPDLFCLTVEDGTFRFYSGNPDSLLVKDENASRPRWERLLRLRHVEALQKAIVSFYALEEDRSFLQNLLVAINKTAVSVFRAQEETVELYCYRWTDYTPPCVLLSEAELPDKTRSALREALLHVSKRTVHVLIPFDYAPSAPGSDFWREIFNLPTTLDGKEIPVEDRRGTLIVPAESWGFRYSDWRYTVVACALGVTPCEIQHCVELRRRRNLDKHNNALYGYGFRDAIKATSSSVNNENRDITRTLYFYINSPEVSIAALDADLEELGGQHLDYPIPDEG